MRRLATRRTGIAFIVIALGVAVGLGAAASPFASAHPDGLERVAADHGFADAATAHHDPPLADYAFPGAGGGRVATGLAGLVGTLGVFVAGLGVAWALSRSRRARGTPPRGAR